MRKLILLASISHMSFQLIFLFSTLSHLIHWPCLACDTALAHLLNSSYRRTSAATNFRRSSDDALFQQGRFPPSPKPLLPCWICPTMSPWWRADFACCVAFLAVHFFPVARVGAAARMTVSLDSARVISSLTLVHLYSSLKGHCHPSRCSNYGNAS